MDTLHLLALMTFARPILSRRFSCILLTSAMDNNDSEHIDTYVDNIEREEPRPVDSADGECPTETPVGIGTFHITHPARQRPMPFVHSHARVCCHAEEERQAQAWAC